MLSGAEEEKVITKILDSYPQKKEIEEEISKVKSETKKE
jgi:hypothetical protein